MLTALTRTIVIDQGPDLVDQILPAAIGAILAFAGAWLLWRRDRVDRRDDRIERGTLQDEVNRLRTAQNEILGAMSEAIRAAIDPAARQKLGAAISLEMITVRTIHPGRDAAMESEWLVVKNLGPGGASVTKLEILTPAAERIFLSWGDDGLIPGGVQELEPGELFYVQALRGMGDPNVVEVVATFTDGTGEHQRRRDLTFAP